MTDRPQDAELHARFDAQRRADASGAPSFASMMERVRAEPQDATRVVAPRRLKQRRFVYAGSLAAAAVVAALLVIPRPQSSEDAFEEAVRTFQHDPVLGAWQSPTDGLLNVPGSQLMSTMPRVGAQ